MASGLLQFLKAVLTAPIFHNAVISLTVSIGANLFIDSRRSKKSVKKYKQARADTERFLRNMKIYQEDTTKIGDYIDEIGEYRFSKVAAALKPMNILNRPKTSSAASILSGFHEYRHHDIENLIHDVGKGSFDQHFDFEAR